MHLDGIDIFKNIAEDIPDEKKQSDPLGNPTDPLANFGPNDKGVDISNLFNPRISKMILGNNNKKE